VEQHAIVCFVRQRNAFAFFQAVQGVISRPQRSVFVPATLNKGREAREPRAVGVADEKSRPQLRVAVMRARDLENMCSTVLQVKTEFGHRKTWDILTYVVPLSDAHNMETIRCQDSEKSCFSHFRKLSFLSRLLQPQSLCSSLNRKPLRKIMAPAGALRHSCTIQRVGQY